jgi:hypothetical protein
MIAPAFRIVFSSNFELVATVAALLISTSLLRAEVRMVTGHNPEGVGDFAFINAASPSKNDAGTGAKFTLLNSDADPNGSGTEQLHDGKLPTEADEPARNFSFAAGSSGGRILIELDHLTEVKQVNTYSWHPGSRGPQVYKLYASDGTATNFNSRPFRSVNLENYGWKLIAAVDTQSKGGGQHGVSISDSKGILGKYRSLLFDYSPTKMDDDFGNTFYSEIDVVELNVPVELAVPAAEAPLFVQSTDGYCGITIDTAKSPELREWAEQKLAPTLAVWYPKIVALMGTNGFSAPKSFSMVIRPGDGVAATSGTRITANSAWLKGELKGGALGALIHEVAHVVQQYGGGRPNGSRAPGLEYLWSTVSCVSQFCHALQPHARLNSVAPLCDMTRPAILLTLHSKLDEPTDESVCVSRHGSFAFSG